jgi:hypothetical protein
MLETIIKPIVLYLAAPLAFRALGIPFLLLFT